MVDVARAGEGIMVLVNVRSGRSWHVGEGEAVIHFMRDA